jgi:hypothetical protein
VLALVRGGVADPNRPLAPVALQVVQGQLDQPPLPAQSARDLQLLGAAGGAALHQPPRSRSSSRPK